MRKMICILLVVLLLAAPVLAAEYDGMTIVQRTYYVDGTEHVVVRDSGGNLYYYIDGVKQLRLGLFFIGGCYYYMSTSSATGEIKYSTSYGIGEAASNGLLPAGHYTFDANGQMVDPPSYPDGWESLWFDTDPTIPPETEPEETEPEETEPKPEESEPVEPDVGDSPSTLFGVATTLYGTLFSWAGLILSASGFQGVYLALFFLAMAFGFLLTPLLKSRRKSGDD